MFTGLLICSGGRQRPEDAQVTAGHEAVCGGEPDRAAPRRQEEEVCHQTEQKLASEVQRNFSIVRRESFVVIMVINIVSVKATLATRSR